VVTGEEREKKKKKEERKKKARGWSFCVFVQAMDKEEERYQRDLAEYQVKLKRYEKYQEELAEYEKAKAAWEQQRQGPYAPGDVRNKPPAQRAAEDVRTRRESPPRAQQQPPHLQVPPALVAHTHIAHEQITFNRNNNNSHHHHQHNKNHHMFGFTTEQKSQNKIPHCDCAQITLSHNLVRPKTKNKTKYLSIFLLPVGPTKAWSLSSLAWRPRPRHSKDRLS